jgi:hypothetical protein
MSDSVRQHSVAGLACVIGLVAVAGAVAQSPTPSAVHAAVPSMGTVVPARLLDTRADGATVDGVSEAGGKVAAGEFVTVQVAGRGNVPASATGAELNLTAIQAESRGFATLYPCTASPPVASSLNFETGVNVANATTVALSAAGEVCIYTSAGAHFALDVVAFIASSATTRTYELISSDVNGDRKSASWDNMQALAKYSVSESSVVFAMRSGLSDGTGYVPIADDEPCRFNFCEGLYVRNLESNRTESATKKLDVINPPEGSGPSLSGWAVSADHRFIFFRFFCGPAYSPNTHIGGTQVCQDHDAYDPLVALDMVSGAERVVATSAVVSGVSEDGGVIMFFDDTTASASLVPCWLPGTCTDSPIWISTGAGHAEIIGHRSSRQGDTNWEMLQFALSGDGTVLSSITQSTDLGGATTWLTVYDRSDSSFRMIPLPLDHPPGVRHRNWSLLGIDRAGENLVVARQLRASAPSNPGGDVYDGDQVLSVSVPSMQVRNIDSAGCTTAGFATSLNGRYLACKRNNRGFRMGFDESPAVLDIQTGEIEEFMTPAEGFDVGRYGPVVISNDGRTAAVLTHRAPDDEPLNGIDEILSRQIYAVRLD